jgi:SAM-dependent methyltransferase
MNAAGQRATERLEVDQMRARMPALERYLPVLLERLGPFVDVGPGSRALDIGAAQGQHVIGLQRLGLDAVGLEPWPEAIERGSALAAEMGTEPALVEGVAEDLPFADSSMDVVFAFYVMEHVESPDRVFEEVYRVLRPGGGFFFATNSALCPRQSEIRGFPLFPWYPGRVKRRVMDWALEHRPDLIGNTATPAYHWFTPWGVRQAMSRIGFGQTVDRWELRLDRESSGWRAAAVRLAKRSGAARLLGDIAVPECSYLVVK